MGDCSRKTVQHEKNISDQASVCAQREDREWKYQKMSVTIAITIILYSSQQEIKAVVRSHNEEHISIILSHETHAHTHS